MKIIKLFSIALIAIVCSFNLFLSTQMFTGYSVNLSQLEALAYDLPEVTITCDQVAPGLCWKEDCHWVPTPFGGWFMTYCPEFTGYQNDYCQDRMPC